MSARRSDVVALCLFGALAGMGLVRATTVQARTPWWDLDPVTHPMTETGLLVSAQLGMDAAVWLIAGLSAVWSAARGQRVRFVLGGMLCFAAMGVLLHGREVSSFVADEYTIGDFRSLVVGSGWVSALVGAWAAAHLVRCEAVRRIAPGVLGGLVFMLLARGALQVFVEHAYTVRAFEADPAGYLARSGIEPGTALARVFERRLRHPDAVGWFGLSNVYGGVAAGCAVMLIGVVIGGWRGMGRWTRWLIALGTAAGLGCVALSSSKGAVGATALGILIVTVAMKQHKRLGGRVWGAIGLACVFGVIALVALRGLIGERLGELSLLFRWQYLVGAARIAAEFPIGGCGVARFQDAYLVHKVPTNPEEVSRAHNVIADWVATLGVFGWAMVCVLLRFAWDAGSSIWHAMRSGEVDEGEESDDGGDWKWILAIVGLSVAGSIWMEQAALEAVSAIVRLGACVLWICAAVVLSRVRHSARWAGIGMGTAALVLIAHGQIEVGMVQNGSAAWIFLVIGCAVGMRGVRRSDTRWRYGRLVSGRTARVILGCGGGVVGVAACLVALGGGVIPAVRWESHLHEAAEKFERSGFWESGDPAVLESAGDELFEAMLEIRGDTQAFEECVRVMTLAYGMREADVDTEHGAENAAESMVYEWPGRSKSWAMVASVRAVGAVRSGAAEDWRGVAEAWERAAELEPYGLMVRWRALEARIGAGDLDIARAHADELLRLNELYRLDPVKQLSDERLRMAERIARQGGEK